MKLALLALACLVGAMAIPRTVYHREGCKTIAGGAETCRRVAYRRLFFVEWRAGSGGW